MLVSARGPKAFPFMGYGADRTYLKIVQEEFEHLPLDVLLEALISFVLSLVGVVMWRPGFQTISAVDHLNTRYVLQGNL